MDCKIGEKHLHRYTAWGIVEPRSVSSSTWVINSPFVIVNRTNLQLHRLDCMFRSLNQLQQNRSPRRLRSLEMPLDAAVLVLHLCTCGQQLRSIAVSLNTVLSHLHQVKIQKAQGKAEWSFLFLLSWMSQQSESSQILYIALTLGPVSNFSHVYCSDHYKVHLSASQLLTLAKPISAMKILRTMLVHFIFPDSKRVFDFKRINFK